MFTARLAAGLSPQARHAHWILRTSCKQTATSSRRKHPPRRQWTRPQRHFPRDFGSEEECRITRTSEQSIHEDRHRQSKAATRSICQAELDIAAKRRSEAQRLCTTKDRLTTRLSASSSFKADVKTTVRTPRFRTMQLTLRPQPSVTLAK